VNRSPRHGPNRLNSYLNIHVATMGQLIYTGAVEVDEIDLPNGADGELFISGRAILRDRKLRVDVLKALEITDASNPRDPLVQTISYSYDVVLQGRSNVFRYCSPHGEDHEIEHHRHHHRHQFDPFGPSPDEYTVAIDYAGDWPTLGQVIQEADTWYWENVHRL